MNGDGLADLVVGAPKAYPAGGSYAGESYVVFSPLILGDLDGDGSVSTSDLLMLLGSWGPCANPCPPFCQGDLNGDCAVSTGDLLTLLGNWGTPP